jgi:hypothetical protein
VVERMSAMVYFAKASLERLDQEAVMPFSGASATTSTLIWDDKSFTTSAAIVNLSSLPNTVTWTSA